jgi:hypothetical protein
MPPEKKAGKTNNSLCERAHNGSARSGLIIRSKMHFAQETDMRKALSIIAAAAIVGVAYQTLVVGSTESTTEKEMAGIRYQNGVSVDGLRIALPAYMTNFQKDLVPLP